MCYNDYMNDIRLCECHGVEMMRYQSVRYNPKNKSQPYYWRCRIKYREWQRNHRKKMSPSLKYQYGRKTRLKKFGITEADYEKLLNEQGGVCAICGGQPDTRWKIFAVDHDHATGKVRGLLCMVCNTMLGRLEKRFKVIMRYLNV